MTRSETVQNLGGSLCCRAEWSTGPPLGGDMVLGKGVVRNSGADLQHAMGASWGPTHLLVGAHPTGDRRKVGGQAATAIGGCGSLVGRNCCPKPVLSVPL